MQNLKQTGEERRASRARHYAEMLVLMRGIARRYKNIVNKISKAEMNASFIEYEMFQLVKMMEEWTDETDDNRDTPEFDAQKRDGVKRPLRYLAESGASTLEIKALPDGSAMVRIDGGKEFTLPPTLVDLMSALSIDNGQRDDAFVGWKSVKEVAEFLTKRSGKPATKRAITQNLYRLRRELFERGGVNPYLVQTNRRRGLRFALRRRIVS